jgi:hypothetical protein
MIIGDIIFPRYIPNLNQSLFNEVRIFELNKPRTKNIKEIINDQTLISLLYVKGYKDISRKTIKKTIPKLLLELILTLLSNFESILKVNIY